MQNIYVTKPFLPPIEEYVNYLSGIWERGILTNNGPLLNEFTRNLENLMNSNVVPVTNGHLALESAIHALNLPKGTEVITTPFTFVSTIHAIVNNGFTPVFCDIKLNDYCMDENKIEALINHKTGLILPVHVYGFPCDVERIEEIASKHKLKVIYDAAHAFHVKVNNKPITDYGDVSMISFHATKLFHTIEGGVVVSSNKELLTAIEQYINFGITSPETVEQVGINAKMNEFQAAMGLAILPHLEEIIQKRKELWIQYQHQLNNIPGILCSQPETNVTYNYAYLPILIDEKQYGMTREELYQHLLSNGIFPRKYFSPLVTDFECYKNQYMVKELKNAKYVAERILTLPIYPDLKSEDVTRICEAINSPVRRR